MVVGDAFPNRDGSHYFPDSGQFSKRGNFEGNISQGVSDVSENGHVNM
jgi:hypothetical protein